MIYIIFFLSITFHEFGHFIVSKLYGIDFKQPKFRLYGFSNDTIKLNTLSILQKMIIFFMGPCFNFLLFIICAIADFKYSNSFSMINLFLGIFNLLPIIPLDGGNILVCFFSIWTNERTSLKYAIYFSRVMLIVITFFVGVTIVRLQNISIVIMLGILWYMYLKEEKELELYERIQKNIKLRIG